MMGEWFCFWFGKNTKISSTTQRYSNEQVSLCMIVIDEMEDDGLDDFEASQMIVYIHSHRKSGTACLLLPKKRD